MRGKGGVQVGDRHCQARQTDLQVSGLEDTSTWKVERIPRLSARAFWLQRPAYLGKFGESTQDWCMSSRLGRRGAWMGG